MKTIQNHIKTLENQYKTIDNHMQTVENHIQVWIDPESWPPACVERDSEPQSHSKFSDEAIKMMDMTEMT